MVQPITEGQKFAEIMYTLTDLKEENKTIFEMDDVKESKIRQVANSGKIVAAKAQVVLEIAKDEVYFHPIKKGEVSEDKSLTFNLSGNDEQNTSRPEYLRLYPNPNNGNMEIEYNLPENSVCVLTFYSVDGKQIAKYNLNPKSKRMFINDSGLFSAGVYQYTLTVDGRIAIQDKLVVVK